MRIFLADGIRFLFRFKFFYLLARCTTSNALRVACQVVDGARVGCGIFRFWVKKKNYFELMPEGWTHRCFYHIHS
jgi:hypothetical protein